MRKYVQSLLHHAMGACLVAFLAACGGGGGAGGAGPTKTSQPTPVPTSTGRQYQVHRVYGFSAGRSMTETVPGNGDHTPALPAGGRLTDGGALASAVITYPDGSVQIADSNGVFLPAASAYAQKNQRKLQTDPNAQPLVVVSDPTGKSMPSTARVAAYGSAPVATAIMRRTQSGSLASIENLTGVSLLQPTSSIFSSDLLDLDIQGSDANNNVVDLSTAQITYPSTTPAGGTIIPVTGTTEAYYFPPDVSSGSLTDSISVTVAVPNTTTQFTATNSVLVVAASNAVAVSGTVQTSSGTAMPAALELFAQLSKYFPPNYWLASADSSGNYTANVPANQLFNIVVGAPPAFSPTGNLDLFVGSSTADGSVTSFAAGSPGSSTLNLFLPPSPTIFTNAGADSLPSFVGFVRDAWYNSVDASQERIFDAGTGIQPLLASVPTSFPSPATPTPIGSGVWATWCYQWEQPTGAGPTLVIAEAEGPNCTQPGNDGITVTPGPSANSYSYVRYISNTAYSIAAPLDVATNGMLFKSGSWTQTLTGTPSAIAADTANVQVQLYDAANQTLGSPIYNESLQYQYSIDAAGLSTEQYSNDTRSSAVDGSIVAVYNATKKQTASLSSCMNSTSQCYAVNGTVQEQYDPSSGAFAAGYTIATTINGDGSQTSTYQSASDGSKVVIPLATNAQQNNSPYCLVCSGNPGGLFDVDGVSQLGSFTVNNARLVQFLVLDPTQGGAQVDSLGFIL